MTFIARKLSTRHRLVVIAALTGGLLLAGPAVSASAAVPVSSTVTHAAAKKTVVPNVVAKSAYDAKNALKKVGLRHKYSAPKGSFVILSKDWTVTKQSPKANAKVPAGTKIKLTVVKTSTLTASAAKPSAPAGPVLSVSQQQAFLAAKGYLATGMGFSHQGLIDQLSSAYGGKFTPEQAAYAVAQVGL